MTVLLNGDTFMADLYAALAATTAGDFIHATFWEACEGGSREQSVVASGRLLRAHAHAQRAAACVRAGSLPGSVAAGAAGKKEPNGSSGASAHRGGCAASRNAG